MPLFRRSHSELMVAEFARRGMPVSVVAGRPSARGRSEEQRHELGLVRPLGLEMHDVLDAELGPGIRTGVYQEADPLARAWRDPVHLTLRLRSGATFVGSGEQ